MGARADADVEEDIQGVQAETSETMASYEYPILVGVDGRRAAAFFIYYYRAVRWSADTGDVRSEAGGE